MTIQVAAPIRTPSPSSCGARAAPTPARARRPRRRLALAEQRAGPCRSTRRKVTASSTLPIPPNRSEVVERITSMSSGSRPGRGSAHVFFVAERERARACRDPGARAAVRARPRRARDRHPLVLEQRLPAREVMRPSGAECRSEIGERRDRVVEEHDTESADDERRRPERSGRSARRATSKVTLSTPSPSAAGGRPRSSPRRHRCRWHRGRREARPRRGSWPRCRSRRRGRWRRAGCARLRARPR